MRRSEIELAKMGYIPVDFNIEEYLKMYSSHKVAKDGTLFVWHPLAGEKGGLTDTDVKVSKDNTYYYIPKSNFFTQDLLKTLKVCTHTNFEEKITDLLKKQKTLWGNAIETLFEYVKQCTLKKSNFSLEFEKNSDFVIVKIIDEIENDCVFEALFLKDEKITLVETKAKKIQTTTLDCFYIQTYDNETYYIRHALAYKREVEFVFYIDDII